MVMLRRWSVEWREHGHVTEVVTLMKGEWSFYINRKFNGWRMVMLRRWAVLMEGEWSCYRGGHFNGGIKVMLQRWCLIGGSMVMLQRE